MESYKTSHLVLSKLIVAECKYARVRSLALARMSIIASVLPKDWCNSSSS